MTQPPHPALEQQSDLDFLTTTYRPDLDILVCRWTDFKDSDHLQQCYTSIFNQGRTHDWHYWLVDIRARKKSEKQDHDWYFSDFLPNQVPTLNGHNFLAYLVSPSHYQYIQELESITRLGNLGKVSSLHTHFFQAENEAINWLVSNRQKQTGN